MRHVNFSRNWKWSEEPFPAYRCQLIYGGNKRAMEFLPVKDVIPDDSELPEGKFKVIKTKQKGTIMVVPGTDDTPRCLGFVEAFAGYRGSCDIVDESTTATIIKKARMHNACDGCTAVVAIFEPGQKVTFYTNGRRKNNIIIFEWIGGELIRTEMTKDEFLSCSTSDVEVDEL